MLNRNFNRVFIFAFLATLGFTFFSFFNISAEVIEHEKKKGKIENRKDVGAFIVRGRYGKISLDAEVEKNAYYDPSIKYPTLSDAMSRKIRAERKEKRRVARKLESAMKKIWGENGYFPIIFGSIAVSTKGAAVKGKVLGGLAKSETVNGDEMTLCSGELKKNLTGLDLE